MGITMSNRNSNRGFTLIEIMVALAIVAILMSIAVPSFRDASLSSQLRSAANNLVASATVARSEAFKRNTPMTMCVSPGNSDSCSTTGSWEQGWIVMAGSTVIAKQSELPDGYKIIAASDIKTFQFQPTGASTTASTLTICRATPNAGNQERVVTINAAGKVSVRTTNTGTCT
jgi:type IV fimbrial biogenesis protein FimT